MHGIQITGEKIRISLKILRLKRKIINFPEKWREDFLQEAQCKQYESTSDNTIA